MRISVHIVRGGAVLTLLIVLALIGQSGSAEGRAVVHLPSNVGARHASPLPSTASPSLPSAGDWPMYGHDWSHTSYNPAETTISADNLDQLESRWQANIGISDYPPSGAPSVANGKVYVGSSVSH